jgi:hypothetical protein
LGYEGIEKMVMAFLEMENGKGEFYGRFGA